MDARAGQRSFNQFSPLRVSKFKITQKESKPAIVIEENERRLSVANQGKKQSIVTKLRQQRELSSAKRLAPIYKKIVAQSHLP